MEKYTERILPIGSIVRVKDTEKELMITGILQKVSILGRPEKHFDYVGVVYPEGHMGKISNIGFNHDDIENVIFYGYTDEKRDAFLGVIEGIFKDLEAKEKQN